MMDELSYHLLLGGTAAFSMFVGGFITVVVASWLFDLVQKMRKKE